VDQREVERIDVASVASDLLEAAEDGTGIIDGPRGAEDGAGIATPDRVPGSRVECSMRKLDCLF
jgi:hypothetical protein